MIRFAIWAAVSSKPQAAADKFSLPVQLERSRAVGAEKGWREAVDPFIVSGQSREHYIQLYQAEQELPAMRQMLAAARERKFDILILAEFDRLRGLMTQVLRTLAQYQVQLFSLSMPIEPVDPQEYNIYKADHVLALITMAQMSSSFEISRMRRKYMDNMPLRISQRGLPKGLIPYGFRKPPGRETDRNAIPVADPVKAGIVIKIKNMFLKGSTHWQIAHKLNADQIPAPKGGKWSDVNVRLILKNKFYSGEVSFGRTRSHTDPLTGATYREDLPPEKWVIGVGKHIPLWDKTTQALIEDQYVLRGKKYTGYRTSRLSHLLYCSVCGARCWVGYPGGYSEERRRWYCSQSASAHITIRDGELIQLVIAAIKRTVKSQRATRQAMPEIDQTLLLAQINQLNQRRRRLVDALEEGSLDSKTYNERVQSLDKQISEKAAELQHAQYIIENKESRLSAIRQFTELITSTPEYITEAPAQEVNTRLRELIDRIIVTPEKNVEILFR